jgi:hypothetical protein
MVPAEYALEILSLLLSEEWNGNHPLKHSLEPAYLRN